MKKKEIYNIIIVSMVMILMLTMQLQSEKQIDTLKDLLLEKQSQTDSLKSIIDTLQWETEIWDHNITYNETHLLSAIIHVESSNNDSAYHKGEDAVGCLQIRQCMVDDVNRILKRQKLDKKYNYDDRWFRYKSIEMFEVYCKHYGLITAEEIARCWNGGPRGMKNDMTAGYWEKVKNQLNS